MNVPRSTMEAELKGQEKELSDDISSLNKKVGRIIPLLLLLTVRTVEILRETIQRRPSSITRHREFNVALSVQMHSTMATPLVSSCTDTVIDNELSCSLATRRLWTSVQKALARAGNT